MMPDPLQYVLWLLSFLLQAGVVVFSMLRGGSRYAPLMGYMLGNALVNVLQFWVIQSHGFQSEAYTYFYYYSETALVVALFFAIITLYQHVFQELSLSRYVRGGAGLLLAATAVFSGIVIQKNSTHLTSRFVVELGQNLYFVGVVLTYVLWGVVMQLKESRVRLLQLIFSLGINFSVMAASYALRNMFEPLVPALQYVPQIASVFLAGAWLHTFAQVSEDQRLATASVAVGAGQAH